MADWDDPRASWTPLTALFIVGFVFVIELSRPAGVLGSGLWIPVLYAVVPVTVGVLAYVKTRSSTGRPVSAAVLVGLTVWGLIGAIGALVIALIIGLGRPTPPGAPSALFDLLSGVLTYLVPTGVFAALYGEAGRRSRRRAMALAIIAPVVAILLLALVVRVSW